MKKKLTVILAAALCAALLAVNAAPVLADDGADTLRAVCMFTSGTFDPLVYGSQDKMVMHSLYDCLFKFDNDGNVIPMLCTDYEQDGLDVTLHLRDDATFSDGNPLTAADVVFSYNKTLEDPTLAYNMIMFSTGLEVVDETTLLLHLANGYAKWQNFLAELLYVVEEAAYDPEADITTTAPIGSGAYTFGGQDESGKVTLNAREDYWGGAPEYKTVEVIAQMDDATALIAMQNNEVDLIAQVGQPTYVQASADPSITTVAFDGWQNEGIMIFVGDDAFRQAVFHAIDRETMLLICTEGNGSVSENMYARKIMGEYEDVAPFTGYDVELAQECLAQSGYDYSEPITIEVFDNDSAAAAQCVQADLAAIGITVQISQEDTSVWFENLMTGNMAMGMATMGTDMVNVEDMITMLDTTGGGYPFQVSEELLADVLEVYTVTEENRYELVSGILEQMAVECQWVPLYDAPMYMIYSNRVGGVNDCSAATYVFYFADMTIAE